jgi:hypothetical protein
MTFAVILGIYILLLARPFSSSWEVAGKRERACRDGGSSAPM